MSFWKELFGGLSPPKADDFNPRQVALGLKVGAGALPGIGVGAAYNVAPTAAPGLAGSLGANAPMVNVNAAQPGVDVVSGTDAPLNSNQAQGFLTPEQQADQMKGFKTPEEMQADINNKQFMKNVGGGIKQLANQVPSAQQAMKARQQLSPAPAAMGNTMQALPQSSITSPTVPGLDSYNSIFSSDTSMLQPLELAPLGKPKDKRPMPIMSDSNNKTNVQDASRSVKDFLAKVRIVNA